MSVIRSHRAAFAAIILLVLLTVSRAEAASLSLGTGSGYSVGQTFSARISVSTPPGESINAVSASVSYPADKLQLISIAKSPSIVSMWANEPAYGGGSAEIEGVILNPGFTGQDGLVATLNFRVLAAGPAVISFRQASVLANDGKGTNVLIQAPSRTVALSAGEEPANESATSDAPDGSPAAPVISSVTHPDPGSWYATSTAIFSWTVPPDVTSVRLQYDESPIAVPGKTYSPPISGKAIEGISDGVYYLHAQFKNAYGWGAVANFKFRVDVTPPVPFKVRLAHDDASTDPRPILLFNTTDALSGMDHYDVKVGDLNYMTLSADRVSSNPYAMPIQEPGTKTVVVNAFDKAGNQSTASSEIDISAINPPLVTDYADDIEEADLLRILGKTYPYSTVTVRMKDPDGVETVEVARSNFGGDFSLVWPHHLRPGIYKFTTEVTDEKGAKSFPSAPNAVRVEKSAAAAFGSTAVNYLAIVIFALAIAALLAALVMYAIHRLKILRHRLRISVTDAEREVHKRFDALESLEESMLRHLAMLDRAKTKRELTKEEASLLASLKRHLASAEHEITEKLEAIRKEVK